MHRRLVFGSALAICAACLGGCGDGVAERSRVIEVWFSRGEEPVAVERRLEAEEAEGAPGDSGESAGSVAAALGALLAGPTAEERAAGLGSWFSAGTAGALGSVELRDGFLRVDFRGLDGLIPGASSSAGSRQLLTALDSTVFQFPAVDSVEYRLDGSCDAFWAWLQRECRVVRRR